LFDELRESLIRIEVSICNIKNAVGRVEI